MNRLLEQDSWLIRFLTRTCDLIFLNLLLIFSCMTVVCAGAALTALYSVTLRMMRTDTDSVVKGYLCALRDNFTVSLPAAVLLFADGFLLALLRYALYAETLVFSPYLFVILAILMVFLTALLSYVFPLLARYDNTFSRQLKNAVRLSIVNLPVTVLVTAVNLLPLLIRLFLPSIWKGAVGFWLLIGAAACAYLNSFYLNRIFQKEEARIFQEETGA